MLYRIAANNDFLADVTKNGDAALQMRREKNYSLILIDIDLKEVDGFELIKKIRSSDNNIPIMMVSGRKEDFDAVYGLNIGADDYITKPFNPITLGAKIKALIRRSQNHDSDNRNIIKAGPFTFNTSTLRFYKNNEEIYLTGKEIALMKLFIDNVDRIFPKDMIYELIWGNSIVDENAIMVYINRLRQKIEDNPDHPKYIQNIRGIGYRFVV